MVGGTFGSTNVGEWDAKDETALLEASAPPSSAYPCGGGGSAAGPIRRLRLRDEAAAPDAAGAS